MTTWESEIYNNNHNRLKRLHWWLSGFYCFIFFIIIIFMKKISFFLSLTILMMFIIHVILAIGSGKKLESSRKASEIIGALMLLGFPIGTLVGYFLVQRTLWVEPIESENKR